MSFLRKAHAFPFPNVGKLTAYLCILHVMPICNAPVQYLSFFSGKELFPNLLKHIRSQLQTLKPHSIRPIPISQDPGQQLLLCSVTTIILIIFHATLDKRLPGITFNKFVGTGKRESILESILQRATRDKCSFRSVCGAPRPSPSRKLSSLQVRPSWDMRDMPKIYPSRSRTAACLCVAGSIYRKLNVLFPPLCSSALTQTHTQHWHGESSLQSMRMGIQGAFRCNIPKR